MGRHDDPAIRGACHTGFQRGGLGILRRGEATRKSGDVMRRRIRDRIPEIIDNVRRWKDAAVLVRVVILPLGAALRRSDHRQCKPEGCKTYKPNDAAYAADRGEHACVTSHNWEIYRLPSYQAIHFQET